MGILVQLRPVAPPRRGRTSSVEVVRLESLVRPPRVADQPLDCLAGGALAARFHAWRGLSGRRYVCSVFPARRGASLGGLPEFDDAVVIAVDAKRSSERRRIAVFELRWRRGRFCGDLDRVKAALEAGVREWHVHLLAESAQARRAAIADLTPPDK
jgi:hypothetical protein